MQAYACADAECKWHVQVDLDTFVQRTGPAVAPNGPRRVRLCNYHHGGPQHLHVARVSTMLSGRSTPRVRERSAAPWRPT